MKINLLKRHQIIVISNINGFNFLKTMSSYHFFRLFLRQSNFYRQPGRTFNFLGSMSINLSGVISSKLLLPAPLDFFWSSIILYILFEFFLIRS